MQSMINGVEEGQIGPVEVGSYRPMKGRRTAMFLNDALMLRRFFSNAFQPRAMLCRSHDGLKSVFLCFNIISYC